MARGKTDRNDKICVSIAAPSEPDRPTTAYREAVEKSKIVLLNIRHPTYSDGYYDDAVAVYVGLEFLEKNPALLVADSASAPEDFLALRLGVAAMLEAGEPLPPEALIWLVQYLRGNVSRPAKKTGAKSKSLLHNLIAQAVAECLKFGLRPTRNDASPAVSACDAVAEAMAELELRPSTFHGVKRIWLDLPPHVRERHVMQADRKSSTAEE